MQCDPDACESTVRVHWHECILSLFLLQSRLLEHKGAFTSEHEWDVMLLSSKSMRLCHTLAAASPSCICHLNKCIHAASTYQLNAPICFVNVLDTLNVALQAQPCVVSGPRLPPTGGGSSSARILSEGLAGTCVPTAFGWSKAEIPPRPSRWDWSSRINALTSTCTNSHTDNAPLVLLPFQRLRELRQT